MFDLKKSKFQVSEFFSVKNRHQEIQISQTHQRSCAQQNFEEINHYQLNDKRPNQHQIATNLCLQQVQSNSQKKQQLQTQIDHIHNIESEAEVYQEKFVTKHKKKIIVGLIISIVLIFITIGIIIGVVVGTGQTKPQNINVQDIAIGGIYIPRIIQYLDQGSVLLSHGDSTTLAGGVSQQSIDIKQKNKIKVNIPLLSLIQVSCSNIAQDPNKLIQSQQGMSQFQSQIILAIRSKLVLNGTDEKKAEISQVDSVKLILVKYDFQNQKLKVSKFEKQQQRKQTNTQQEKKQQSQSVGTVDLSMCQVDKAVIEGVKILKQLIQKRMAEYQKQAKNGSLAQFSKEVEDNKSNEESDKIKEFKQNCIYVDSLLYKCKQNSVKIIVTSQNEQENKQNEINLDDPKDETVLVQQITFTVSYQ